MAFKKAKAKARGGKIQKQVPLTQYLGTAELRSLELMLWAVANFVKSQFDGNAPWQLDAFGIFQPDGTETLYEDWKALSDPCHGASYLLSAKAHKNASHTLQIVDGRLKWMAQQRHDPWVVIYIWKILLYVRGISGNVRSKTESLFKHFLKHLTGVFTNIPQGRNPMVILLDELSKASIEDVMLYLERVYKRAIHAVAPFLGPKHPLVLGMWNHFYGYWMGSFAPKVLELYAPLSQATDATLDNTHPQAILIRRDYMIAAHKYSNRLDIAYQEAHKLRAITSPLLGAQPVWDSNTFTYVLASKHLARVAWESKPPNLNECFNKLESIVSAIKNGDDECRLRAAQVQWMLCWRYRESGDSKKAAGAIKTAAEMRNTLPDSAEDDPLSYWFPT